MPYRVKQDLEVSGTGTFDGNVSVPAGTTNLHAINKLQLDNAVNSIRNRDDSKPSVRATIGNSDIDPENTFTTVTGVTLQNGDRVLVASNGANVGNGPYIVSAGIWLRADDGTISSQSNWRVEEGTNSGFAYVVTTSGNIVLGTTPITIVQIAGANNSLLADSLGSTEIVTDEIRVKRDLGSGNGGVAQARIISTVNGIYTDQSDISNLVARDSTYAKTALVVAFVNVPITSQTLVIDGQNITWNGLDPNTNVIDRSNSVVVLSAQTNPIQNGVYKTTFINQSSSFGLTRISFGTYFIEFGTASSENWLCGNGFAKRLSATTYLQTLPSGAATTHTINHNKRTTRPQVRLFDSVTNEELFAQPSNISLNSLDLVLSSLSNNVQVVVNITPDA